jgi:hypothetical protein
MPRYGLDDGQLRFPTDGALAANRLVKLGSDGFPDLADDDDTNVIGSTLNSAAGAADINRGVVVALKSKAGVLEVEVAGGETITRGDLAFQATGGMIAAAGTIVAGIALVGGTAGQLVEILPV